MCAQETFHQAAVGIETWRSALNTLTLPVFRRILHNGMKTWNNSKLVSRPFLFFMIGQNIETFKIT